MGPMSPTAGGRTANQFDPDVQSTNSGLWEPMGRRGPHLVWGQRGPGAIGPACALRRPAAGYPSGGGRQSTETSSRTAYASKPGDIGECYTDSATTFHNINEFGLATGI